VASYLYVGYVYGTIFAVLTRGDKGNMSIATQTTSRPVRVLPLLPMMEDFCGTAYGSGCPANGGRGVGGNGRHRCMREAGHQPPNAHSGCLC
jgi:hypothetical protein